MIRKQLAKALVLALMLTTLAGCGAKTDIRPQVVDEEYTEGSYELLTARNRGLEIGTKLYLFGQLDPIAIRSLDLENLQYEDEVLLKGDKRVALLLMKDHFGSRTQAANFSFERLDEIRGKDGKFYVEYLGKTEYGRPLCFLDKVEIGGDTFQRDTLVDVSSISGTIDNPAKVGMRVLYDEYDANLEIKLVKVMKGEEARKAIEGFDDSNRRLLKGKNIVMAKFSVCNIDEPYDISHLNFRYSNQNLAAQSKSPYLSEVKDELNFTVFREKDAEGWVFFETDSEDAKGYAVFNKELWFELF